MAHIRSFVTAGDLPAGPARAFLLPLLRGSSEEHDTDTTSVNNNNASPWGLADELGMARFALNRAQSACRLITDGFSVSLAHPVSFNSKDDEWQSTRLMLETGDGRFYGGDSMGTTHGGTERQGPAATKRRNIKEQISLVFHGRSITHIDSPAHFSWRGRMFNGFIADGNVTHADGCRVLSVAPLAEIGGLHTRGILLDAARWCTRSQVPPDEEAVGTQDSTVGSQCLNRAVRAADLRECLQRQKLQVCEGDVVFVRTGWTPGMVAGLIPALHPDCLQLLQEWRVAMLGSDTPNDVVPPLFDEIEHPIHVGALVLMGLWMCDNAALEALGDECDKRQRWEFFLSLAPLPLPGVSGSPVNPVAIF